MSCEKRHHALVTKLLLLAGITQPTADVVMNIGQGQHVHRPRRGYRTDDLSETITLHPAICDALQIRGHADHTIPSWGRVLLSVLLQAQGTGNRNALLTLLLLTGGWDAVTPQITDGDIGDMQWLQKAQTIGVPIPPALDDRLQSHLRFHWRVAITNAFSFEGHQSPAMLVTVLDALPGIDAMTPGSVRTVTAQQALLRFLVNKPLVSHSGLQCVLRALIEGAPVAHTTIMRLTQLGWQPEGFMNKLLTSFLYRAAQRPNRSFAQAGIDILLDQARQWLATMTSAANDPSFLSHPSVAELDSLARYSTVEWVCNGETAYFALTTLCYHWRQCERNDAIAKVMQTLLGVRYNTFYAHQAAYRLLLTGVVDPPHGDRALPCLIEYGTRGGNTWGWETLVSGAVYAAACQRSGHLPAVDGIIDAIHATVQNRTPGNMMREPSPAPILTVGRERDVIRTVARIVADDPVHWTLLIFDYIDAMDAFALVGGDPSEFQAALIDALTMQTRPVEPWIVVRLAASPYGQRILPHLRGSDTLSPWRTWAMPNEDLSRRLVRHLSSPFWDTAPPSLRAWWDHTIAQIKQSDDAFSLGALPIYPTVMPHAAMVLPNPSLISRALAHVRWDDIPEADRRRALHRAYQAVMKPLGIVRIASSAATDTARQDVLTVVETLSWLSDDQKGNIRQLIGPAA